MRWDSLGEYLAIAVSLEHLAEQSSNERAKKLSVSLNQAIERILQNRRSPSRKVNEIDNRASNFYVCLYWAELMAEKDKDFKDLALKLKEARHKVIEEFKLCQGRPTDVGGYYKPDPKKAEVELRPSPTFNSILDSW